MNKNDLRFKKTEILIKESYLALKKNGKAVKVKDLCEKAMINKTTFYSHYETIEELNDRICSELIAELLNRGPHISLIFTDTKTFITQTYNIFYEKQSLFIKLYNDDINALINDIEKEMFKKYISDDMPIDLKLTIRFGIGGAARLFSFEQDKEQMDKAINLVEEYIKSMNLMPDILLQTNT